LIVFESLDHEVLELFTNYEQAASVLRAWDRDEPDERATSTSNQSSSSRGGLN